MVFNDILSLRSKTVFKMFRSKAIIFVPCLVFTFIVQSSGQNVNCQTYLRDEYKESEYKSNRDCSFKVFNRNTSKSECKIIEYNYESRDCNEMEFKNTNSKKLSDMRIKVYPHHKFMTTVDNITFSNNKWTHLKFKLRDRVETEKCFCQEIHLLPGIDYWNDAVLTYDCPLFGIRFQHHEFDLYYAANNSEEEEFKHYILNKPMYSAKGEGTDVKERDLFIYVDVTDAPNLQVRWQAVTGIKSYIVRAIDEATESVLSSETVPALLEEEELFFNTKIYGSKVYFTVQIKHKNCGEDECISKSALIYMETIQSWPLIVGACVAFIILVLLCSFFFWFVQKLGKSACPVVLIIYKRSAQFHVDVVKALADYLRKECHIDAKIDEFDIPFYVDKNPFNWCQETFRRADVVMVLSSPQQAANYETGIYRDVVDVGLRLLQENFCDSSKKFFSVLLPYCEKKDIPVEAINLQCFKLTKDLDDMLWYIHHNSNSVCLSRLRILVQTQMPGGKHKLGKQGILLNSIRKATEDVKRLRPQVVNTSNTTPPELPLVVLPEKALLLEHGIDPVCERIDMHLYDVQKVLTESEAYNNSVNDMLNFMYDDNIMKKNTCDININDLQL